MPDIAAGQSPQPPTLLRLPESGYGSFSYWKDQRKFGAEKRDQDFKPLWDANIASYMARGPVKSLDDDGPRPVVVPKDFANVEQKKAQLFFQLPKIIAKPLRPDLAQTVPMAQAILRFFLGPARMDAMKMMGECLFDALCPAGLMACKIGYESIQDGFRNVTIQMPAPTPSTPPMAPPLGGMPQPGAPPPGSVLGLNGPSQPPPTVPVDVPVPRIISERYFMERISPAKLLIPDGFSGSNYDLAPWLGFEFEEVASLLQQRYGLDDDEITKVGADDEHKLKSETQISGRSRSDKVRGCEIWYKASLYDPNEKHPEKLRVLVMLDGLDRPVEHRDSPYQRFDPDTGRLLIGMRGFPVQIGALRYVSDTAYPPSECSISRHGVDELSRYRTQQIVIRDRAVPILLGDLQRLGGPATFEKIRRGDIAPLIPVTALDASNPPIIEAAKAHLSQDSYRGNDQIDRDISEVWAFGPNQRGQEAVESRTATEMQIAQANASARISAERRETMDFFVKCATKAFSLIQVFADKQEFVEILGDDGERRLEAWDRTSIAGEYLFEAKPDSAAQIDYVQERGDLLKFYELARRDPNISGVEILNRLAVAFDFDPSRLVVTQLPPKGPRPAAITMTLKGDELDLGRPEFPLLYSILQQSGYQFPPDLMQQMQQHKQQQTATMMMAGIGPEGAGLTPAGPAANVPVPPNLTHPGSALKVPRLRKHQEKETRQLPGPKGPPALQ